jgi:phosphatidylinositol 4-kinase
MLVAPDILDRLHRLLIDINQEEDANANVIQFIRTFLARYISRSRPLSGYFLVCCVIETQWTALAQALAPAQSIVYGNIVEAAAANKAWLFLMRKAALNLQVTDEKIRDTLKMTSRYAMQCFTDLLVQIEEMDSEPPIDTTHGRQCLRVWCVVSSGTETLTDFAIRNSLPSAVLHCMSLMRSLVFSSRSPTQR